MKRTKAQRHVRKRAQIALAAAWKMLRKTGLPRKRQSQILTLVIANFAREGMGIPPHPWNYFDKEEDFPTIGGANQARMKRNAR